MDFVKQIRLIAQITGDSTETMQKWRMKMNTELELFMKKATAEPELERRLNACNSMEEIAAIAVEYGVEKEILKQALFELDNEEADLFLSDWEEEIH